MHERKFRKRQGPAISVDVKVVSINEVDSRAIRGLSRKISNSSEWPNGFASKAASPFDRIENTRSSVLAITLVFGWGATTSTRRLSANKNRGLQLERPRPFTIWERFSHTRIIGRLYRVATKRLRGLKKS